ncbi:MAG: CocE/NonD family hydrolase [Pyrinomonadaceae bacterium]
MRHKLVSSALRGLIIIFCVVIIFVVAGHRPALARQTQTAQPSQPSPTPPLPAVPPAARYKGYTDPAYTEIDSRSLYVTTKDGVRLAIDVYLPKGLPAGARVPSLMNQTRYWRAREGNAVGGLERLLVLHGYAVVMVDVRGTGASFGVWTMPWSPAEVKDGGEIVDWIVAQPWSNGRVGAYGNSYSGNSAALLAAPARAAVKAVLPRHYEFDEYTDIAFPGGVFNEWMIRQWNEGDQQLDNNAGVRPVAEDADHHLLQAAMREHAGNLDVYKSAQRITFRDDAAFGATLDTFSLFNYRKEIERSGTLISGWSGWFDAVTADAVIKTFINFSNPQRDVIGPWNHGASQNANPYVTPESPRLFLTYEWLRVFDQYLKGVEADLTRERVLYYLTMGEERWKATKVWPVEGTTPARFYMAADNALTSSVPTVATGADSYKVDFDATTGEQNRWRTQLGGQVKYPDRAAEDAKLLTYTSQPLTEDTEITGYPVVDLYVTSTRTDGNFFVYLEDVDEAGRVIYLTEGQLRALHRKISTDAPPYKSPVPYHSFKHKDAQPLVPGEVAELKFGMQPTSVLIKKGHRIRIAVAGHDRSTFARLPTEGTPTISLARNKRYASSVELPFVRRTAQSSQPVNLLLTAPAK